MNDFSEHNGLRRYPLARRGFVMTSLISGFTLATQRVEAQAIQTDTTGLEAGEVQIPVKDGHMPAYFARPAKGTGFPVILVNEEIFGVHEYIKDVCRRFAKLGYMAVAPEVYARIADLSTMTDVQQIVRDVISKKPDAELMTDLDSTAGLGCAQPRQRDGHRRDRVLPRRTQHLALCRAQSEAQGGGRLVWADQECHQPDPAAWRRSTSPTS